MRLNQIPFGHGSRSCPASNLAMAEIKYAIAIVFRRLRSVPLVAHRDEYEQDIALLGVFAAGPKQGSVWLRFENSINKV